MNRFEESNYYEILEIAMDASLFEIKRAYRNSLELYNERSLLTYSLFSDEERANIIKKIEHAYNTLIDKAKRTEYDLTLCDKSTVADRKQSRDLPLTSHKEESKNAFSGNHNEESLRPGTVVGPSETPKKTSTGTDEKRSSICIDEVCKQNLHGGAFEDDDSGLTWSLRKQVCFKMFVFVSILALILIALATILGPLDLMGRYHLPFTRSESHLEQKRKQAKVELTYAESRNDKKEEEQEKSAYTALIDTEPTASEESNPVLHENLA